VDVYIGTPPQKYTLLLDTGSTDLWIRHHRLSPYAPGNTFHPLQSSTWQQSRSHWGVKYLDATIAEGTEGIERVTLDDVECDARVGVAEKISTTTGKGRVVGVKAGKAGNEGIDGILGIGLGSSIVMGLRKAGVRGFKITFDDKAGDRMELVRDMDLKGTAWYKVITSSDDPAWEIILSRVSYDNSKFPVPRNQRVTPPIQSNHRSWSTLEVHIIISHLQHPRHCSTKSLSERYSNKYTLRPTKKPNQVGNSTPHPVQKPPSSSNSKDQASNTQ
jgi:hypothetical protein